MSETTTTTVATEPQIETTTSTTEVVIPTETTTIQLKTIDEVAEEVWNGMWGDGNERKEKLEEAGYNYDEIQKKVDELSELYFVSSTEDPDGNKSYVGSFQGTWYHTSGKTSKGGSGRQLISCNTTENIKGSIASATLYKNYGYKYGKEGRTKVYLEFSDTYSSMNGFYYVDDCCRDSWVIDFYYLGYKNGCPFRNAGRIYNIKCWICE